MVLSYVCLSSFLLQPKQGHKIIGGAGVPTVSPPAPPPTPTTMTAAIGAKVGRSSPRMRTARNQARQAATAVWRTGSQPLLRRRAPERRRRRTKALFSSADTRDPLPLLPT